MHYRGFENTSFGSIHCKEEMEFGGFFYMAPSLTLGGCITRNTRTRVHHVNVWDANGKSSLDGFSGVCTFIF